MKETYLKDKFACRILSDENTREFLYEMVSKVLNVPNEEIRKDFKLIDFKVGNSVNDKNSETDVSLLTEEGYINIEVNYNYSKTLLEKNMNYVCNLYVKQIGRGSKYEIKPIYQINIDNYDIYGKGEIIYKSIIEEEKYKIEYPNNKIGIYDINMEKIKEIEYNNLEKGSIEYLLYFFICNDTDLLKKIYVGDRKMEKVVEKIDDMEDTWPESLYYNKDEFVKMSIQESQKEEAYNEGKLETTIEIIKKLLIKGISDDEIIELTEITKEELDNIKNKMK